MRFQWTEAEFDWGVARAAADCHWQSSQVIALTPTLMPDMDSWSTWLNFWTTYQLDMCPSLIQIGSKTAEKNSAQTNKTDKQTDKQTDRQTDTTKIMDTWPWTNTGTVRTMRGRPLPSTSNNSTCVVNFFWSALSVHQDSRFYRETFKQSLCSYFLFSGKIWSSTYLQC